MTRRLLILVSLTLALLFSGVVDDSPAPAAAPALVRSTLTDRLPPVEPLFDVRLGDGVLQVRIRGCGGCRAAVSIRIELAGFAADLVAR